MLATFYHQFEEALHREKIVTHSSWQTYAGQLFF